MKRIGMGALALTMVAGPAAAQQDGQSQDALGRLVAQAMPPRYIESECKLEGGHFLISSGKTYLKSAVETGETNRDRLLSDAERVLREAIEEKGQESSSAAWYYLARVSMRQGDLAGADSAFRKAEELSPGCAEEIGKWRQTAYAALVNPGLAALKAEQPDSAALFFRGATQTYPQRPEAWFYLASITFNQRNLDSANLYFERAIAAANDPAQADMKAQAQYYRGVALLQLQKPQDAVPVLEAYHQAKPDDIEGVKALVNAYRAAGMADKAKELEAQLVAAGGAGGGGAVASSDLFSIGVSMYQEKKFAEAAEAFGKVVEQEPYNRDALYNLANTYLALQDWPKLVETSRRLIALDPLNETALKMLGEGFKQTKQIDSALATAERVLGLPAVLNDPQLQPRAGGAAFVATAVGRDAKTGGGRAIAPKPLTLAVEFLAADGTAVGSQEVQLPALAAGATHPVNAEAQGEGIVGWRYKLK